MFEFRPATPNDVYILFTWRNHPDTRKMSINTNEITMLDHLQYIGNVLKSDDIYLFIFLKDGMKIGTIRHENCEHVKHELSWTIAPLFRNKGFGKIMLNKFIKEFDLKQYCATIKPKNIASIKIAESIGMKRTEGNENLLFYEKE